MLGRADLRNEIERDRMGERLVLVLFVVERGLAAVDQVALAADARAAGGLVGADDDAADAAGVVQRLHGDDHLRGRAVRAGDDALVILNGLGIHFRNHQRHLGVHPPVAAFVDDDAAALDGPGDEVLGHRIGRAADRQVDALERLGRQFLDRVLLAL